MTRGWIRGVAAGLVGLGTAEAIAAATRSRSLIDAAGLLVIDSGPVPVVERTVQILKTADKPVIQASVASTIMAASALLGTAPRRASRDALAVGTTAAIGAALTRRRREGDGDGWRPALAATGGTIGALGMLTAPVVLLGPAALVGATGLAASMVVQSRRRMSDPSIVATRSGPRTGGSPGPDLRPEHPLPPAVDGAEDWPGVSPLLTPVERFYVTDVNMRPPVVDSDGWRLAVTGAVALPLSLSYDELIDLGLVEFDAALVCIHNRLGWDRLGNARWLGVPLRQVLDAAAPDPRGTVLVARAVDGWEVSMARDTVNKLAGYVVVGMNGRPLTAAHGFPARVFFPGIYGQYTGPKWLTELRLQSRPNRDYWIPRGWARGPVRVRPLSRIDAPVHRAHLQTGPVDIVGVAWAPPGGVSAVDLAVDDGPWTPAELAAELAPSSWRRWRVSVALPAGAHTLRVRCTARAGSHVQDPTPRPPFPTGVSGHHTITVTAR